MEAIAEPGILFKLVTFLFLLTVLVFVHEWGHYIVARLCKVRVDVFSIGFGPELFGWTDKKGTRWKIAAIPLGGYVKFFGDASAASNPGEGLENLTDEEKAVSFHHKSLGKRAAIVSAGPIVNFIFAIILFAGIFTAIGQPYTPAVVSTVEENSAAFEAGVVAGDRIVDVGGFSIDKFEDLRSVIASHAGMPMLMIVERDGNPVTLSITPRTRTEVDRFGNSYEIGFIGVGGAARALQQRNIFSATYHAVIETGRLVDLMLDGVGQIVTGRRSIDDLGGPVKIAQMTGERAALGIVDFVWFMALISVNLGLVNLFPIPVLDGGHLFFYAIEALRGKPLSARIQEFGYGLGMIFVLGLLVLLTWNDLS